MCTMTLSIRVCLLMLAMSLNSSLVCATQTRLRKRYATGHDTVATPPRLLKEQGSEGVTKLFQQPNRLPDDAPPETRNVNGQEPKISVGKLAALPELRLDELAVDELPLDELAVDEVTVDEVTVDELAVDEVTLNKLALDEVTLNKLALDEDEQASFDENTKIALERHDTPPEERDVTRNLVSGRNTEGSPETIEKVRYNNGG
jgi:hypothetical protein